MVWESGGEKRAESSAPSRPTDKPKKMGLLRKIKRVEKKLSHVSEALKLEDFQRKQN